MNELVTVENNQVVVSSRQVADNFGKHHKDVLASIRGILAAEAARAWAKEYEEKQRALAQVTEMKPKAEFYVDVTGSKDTIDIGSVLNIPNMGRNKLFSFFARKESIK